jgi:hypothetical protein
MMVTKILAKGKGEAVRFRLKEAGAQNYEPTNRTKTAYKVQSPGKLAQHNEAPGSGDRVNAAVV